MADNIQHEDSGKIGGAKKTSERPGLYVNDPDAMNDREAEKFAKKDKYLKQTGLVRLLDDGPPLGVVYFIKRHGTG